MRAFKTLLIREFWEHKILPVIIGIACSLFLIIFIATLFVPTMLQKKIDRAGEANVTLFQSSNSVRLELDDLSISGIATLFDSMPSETQGMAINGAISTLSGLMLVVLFTTMGMLANSLYQERKMRTVLFWRSVPVSDTMVVFSKLVAATLFIPFLSMLAIMATQILFLILISIIGLFNGVDVIGSIWGPAEPLLAWWDMSTTYLGLMVWYLPLSAYLLMISSVSRIQTMVTAVIPPLVLIILERLIYGSAELFHWLAGYVMKGIMIFEDSGMQLTSHSMTVRYGNPLGQFQAGPAVLGLLVSAVFITSAIQIRRRSESF